MKKSFGNRLANKLFKFLNVRNFYENETYLKMQEKHLKKEVKPPLMQKRTWTKHKLGKFTFFKTKNKDFSTAIIYFHGGAFISQPNILHWNFLKKMHTKTDSKVFFPIYPKAPKYTHKDAYKFLFEFLETIKTELKNKKIVFMGDSAGGNIALSFSLQLENFSISKLILFSPCLDLTLSNPEIEKIEQQKLDVLLSKKGLLNSYKKWAGLTPLKSPILSPVNSTLENLPPTAIFVATNEILFPETLMFEKKAKSFGKNITLIIGKEQGHAYPLHPFKESKKSFEKIVELVKNLN